MKVKKYIANTMPEAMNQIRKELGPDAVILNSREWTEKRLLGLHKKKRIEVVAALDPNPIENEKNTQQFKQEMVQPLPEGNTSTRPDLTVMKEIKQLKKMLQQQAFQSNHKFEPEYELVFQFLIDQEVDEAYAKQILNSVVESHKNMSEIPDEQSILYSVQAEMKKMLSNSSFNGITYDKRIVQFVGPTGVGKTTTLAKIAAHSMLKDGKKVAFITADTYRIAAIEQLKTYARILNVPLEVAYSIDDYKKAVRTFEAFDLILVDTAGRNYRNEKYLDELKKTIDFTDDLETYLVLSLTAKANDIKQIYDQFTPLSIKKVIFTKIDETNQYGSILNTALQGNADIAYLTDGQDVPDDLIEPSAKMISDLIVGRYTNE
ncbi:flagellar biosynthesis protein FlhF [Virgibacillus sp. W0430]|uniref:flagellar biosynthesis protein FlhF n=1 Tax=Virgibacillus sp. W0430 TaxID=3391580 RepID=UPI003F459395